MQEAVSGSTCDSNRLMLLSQFSCTGCSTLKNLFHFAILEESKRKMLSSCTFSKDRSGPTISGFRVSCLACRFAMPWHMQNRVPWPREELEMRFHNESFTSPKHSSQHEVPWLCCPQPQSLPVWGCSDNGSQDSWWGSLLSCSHLMSPISRGHHGSPSDFPLSFLFVENSYRNKTWIL